MVDPSVDELLPRGANLGSQSRTATTRAGH
jgi:hypothetical protein